MRCRYLCNLLMLLFLVLYTILFIIILRLFFQDNILSEYIFFHYISFVSESYNATIVSLYPITSIRVYYSIADGVILVTFVLYGVTKTLAPVSIFKDTFY